MAIYHLTASVISRGRGQSVVAAVAYRTSAASHAEIIVPEGSPTWALERVDLWNRVEAGELRKDSQLARLIEVSLPIELSAGERLALTRDFIAKQFVSRGMIADFSIRGDAHNPHAHIVLTLRPVTASGFGPKARRWNGKPMLIAWRRAWAACANEHLASAGQQVRIDDRTLEAQQIELAPTRRVGVPEANKSAAALPEHLADRIADRQRIARENGSLIIEDPCVLLQALTHQRRAFTLSDMARFLRSRTAGTEQFDAAYRAITQSDELVALRVVDGAEKRFTSRDLADAEQSLFRRTASLAARMGHGVAAERVQEAPSPRHLNDLERRYVGYLVGEGDIKAIAVTAESKDAILETARRAWQGEGMTVAGAVEATAGHEAAWQPGAAPVTRNSVLLLDDTQRMGLKDLERALAVVDNARAKLVLVADSRRLHAMKAEPPVAEVLRRVGLPDAG